MAVLRERLAVCDWVLRGRLLLRLRLLGNLHGVQRCSHGWEQWNLWCVGGIHMRAGELREWNPRRPRHLLRERHLPDRHDQQLRSLQMQLTDHLRDHVHRRQ
jgi:hypothetical protein